jgi:glutathione peroxidase
MNSKLYDFKVRHIDGKEATLGEHKGSVMLIVNVASKCGLTPQYADLEKLYEQYRARGLVVLGFPANEFAGQEPGSNQEIAEFCSTKFGVKFPMYERIVVKGDGQHPLYKYLTETRPTSKKNPQGKLRATLDQHGLGPKNETDILCFFEKLVFEMYGVVWF